jgi:hypothetical protein
VDAERPVAGPPARPHTTTSDSRGIPAQPRDATRSDGPRTRRTSGPTRRAVATSVLAAVILAVVACAWHLSATSAYHRSFDEALTLDQRTSAASLATRLEPWNMRFATRETVMKKWQHGALLFSQQAYLPAMLELADAYKLDAGNAELLALLRKAQDALGATTNLKAHVQHGHEGPGGTLRPQDLQR